MKKALLSLLATSSALVFGQQLQIALTANVRYKANGQTLELLGGCTYMDGVSCWDVNGKHSPEIEARVERGMRTMQNRVGIGYKKLNRIVVYKSTQSNNVSGSLYVENRSGEVWLGEESFPADKRGTRERTEYKMLFGIFEPTDKTMSITATLSSAAPVRTLNFREGSSVSIPMGNRTIRVTISKIVKNPTVNPSSLRVKKDFKNLYQVEIRYSSPSVPGQSIFPIPVDKDGRFINWIEDDGKPNPRGSYDSDKSALVGQEAIMENQQVVGFSFFYNIDPTYIKGFNLNASYQTRVAITGVPVNPK